MHIFFDLDGTLVDPFPRLYRIHTFLTHKYSLPSLPYEAYIEQKQKHIPELNYINQKDMDRKEKYRKERLLLLEDMEYLALDTLYPDTISTLTALQKDHSFYLLTVRKKRENLLQQLSQLEIAVFFAEVLSPSPSEAYQDPVIFKQKLAEKYVKEDSVIVGDTEVDIKVGKNLHITSVIISNRLRKENLLLDNHPDYVINTLTQLPVILNS